MRTKLEALVRTVGQQLLTCKEYGIEEKEGIGNYVTQMDTLLQEQLRCQLAQLLPEAGFQGEEDDASQISGLRWIVDPIDGTTNFIRGLHYSCVSVALAQDNTPLLGVVYNPYTDQCYSAKIGEGAWCNGISLQVTDRSLARSLVSVGFTAYEREQTDQMFRLFRNLFDNCEDIRCFGSAALDLCAVAAGALDVFVELQLKPWDYAAAACIITEAGGKISDVMGNPLPLEKGSSVLASNDTAYAQALAFCKESM